MIKNNKKLVAFVCIRLKNERLPGKNLLKLGGRPLYYWIFSELKKIKQIDDVFLYSSSIEEFSQLPEGVLWEKRDIEYDKNVSCSDLLKSFCRKIESDFYLLAHATSPFTQATTLHSMIKSFSDSDNYDSAFTGSSINSFAWQNGTPANFDPTDIKRTQDMTPYFMENVGGYLFTRKQIMEYNRRVGEIPLLWEVPQIETIDIDNQRDYEFAKSIEHILIKRDTKNNNIN